MRIASLPMYDWPEVSSATDALWQAIASALAEAGIEAPDHLTRSSDATAELYAQWRHPGLVIGQTCGLAYAAYLAEEVDVIGSFVLAEPGGQGNWSPPADHEPGDYYSLNICHADQPHRQLADLRGAAAVVNSYDSQSGHLSLFYDTAKLVAGEQLGGFFGDVAASSSHRASIQAVADRRADVAAIDAYSFRLARRFEPAAAKVRVIGTGRPSPGVPLITARNLGLDVTALQTAVAKAIDSLPPKAAETLGLTGFRPRTGQEYKVQLDRWDEAAALTGRSALLAKED